MHHIMVKTIACLVLLGALLTVGLTACGPGEEVITANVLIVKNIPEDIKAKIKGAVILSDLDQSKVSARIAVCIATGQERFEFTKLENMAFKGPWDGSGEYYIVLPTDMSLENIDSPNRVDYVYTGGIESSAGEKYNFSQKETIIEYTGNFVKNPSDNP